MSNEELVLKVQAGEDVDKNIERLYLQNEGLIRKVSSHYMGVEDLEDLKQESYFGLITAIELWTPDGGANFATYAFQWIRQTLRRYIDNCGTLVRLPSHAKDRIFRYKQAVENFRQEFMRDPTSRELALYLGVTLEEVDKIKRDAFCLNPRSTNEIISEDESLTLEDLLEDEKDDVGDLLDEIQKEELSLLLWSLVDELEKNEAEVIRKRYKYGHTLQSCGEELGISKDKVRNIESKALRKMRRSSVRKKLEPYIDERVVSVAYKSTGLGSFKRTWTSAPEMATLILENNKNRRATGSF